MLGPDNVSPHCGAGNQVAYNLGIDPSRIDVSFDSSSSLMTPQDEYSPRRVPDVAGHLFSGVLIEFAARYRVPTIHQYGYFV
jgi:hypothetical protein